MKSGRPLASLENRSAADRRNGRWEDSRAVQQICMLQAHQLLYSRNSVSSFEIALRQSMFAQRTPPSFASDLEGVHIHISGAMLWRALTAKSEFEYPRLANAGISGSTTARGGLLSGRTIDSLVIGLVRSNADFNTTTAVVLSSRRIQKPGEHLIAVQGFNYRRPFRQYPLLLIAIVYTLRRRS